MYKFVEINNFRGFRRLTLDKINRINLVTGVNNVGKTTMLEAMFLHGGAYNPTLTLNIDRFRGIDKISYKMGQEQTPWDSLFNDFDTSSDIMIRGDFSDGSSRKISLQVVHPSEDSNEKMPIIQYGSSSPLNREGIPASPENTIVLKLNYEESPGGLSGASFLILGPEGPRVPLIKAAKKPMIFLPARLRVSILEDAERFSKLDIEGSQNMLRDALKSIEPRLKRVAIVAIGGVTLLYGDIGLSRMLALPYMGDGMSRLASLILAIGNARDGAVLIDEIENGFHHAMMPKVWEAIDRASRDFNTQVFASTHSLECVISAHKAFSKTEYPDNLLIHRLERVDGDVVNDITFGPDDLKTALELKLDIRGVRRWE